MVVSVLKASGFSIMCFCCVLSSNSEIKVTRYGMIRLYCTEDLSSGLIMNRVVAFDRLFRRFQVMFCRHLSLDNRT